MSSSDRRKDSRAGGNVGWQHVLSIGSIAIAALIAGCGGGGGGGDPVVSQTPSRAIYVSNAESTVKLTLEMMDLTDVLATSWGLGSGINETTCEAGSGVGTVSNCVIGTNTFNGQVTATITDTKTLTVPGDNRERVMPTSMDLAISNLQWQSSKNFTTYTIAGNLSLTYTYPASAIGLGTASVTGTLTLTDTATGARYQYRSLTQRYSITVDQTVADYQFEHTDHKGDIVYMDENTRLAMQPGNVFEYLNLTGDLSRLSVVVDLFGGYSIRLDSDGDTNYDTFAKMPLSEIGRGDNVSSSALTVGIARQGSGDAALEKRRAVTLTANANDADYNFHQFSWQVTNHPSTAVGDNAPVLITVAQSTGTQSFTGFVAGDYDITVTATEVGVDAPKTATAVIRLTVGMDTPQLSVTGLDGAIGTVSTPVGFPITRTNLEGNVITELLSAPAGMVILGDHLLWIPQRQFFPGTTETVTLRISNEDQSTVTSYAVTVNDPAAQLPLTTPGLLVNGFPSGASLTNADGDNLAELLMASSGSAFFGLNLDGSTPTAAIANPYALSTDAGDLLAVRPLRTNGVVGAYAIAATRGVFVVDATTFAVRASRGLLFNPTASTSSRRFAVADVNNDGSDEIIALTKTAGSTTADQLFVLNQDLSTRASSATQDLGQQFLVGNVDGDADLEIVCGNGLIANAATLATEVAAGTLSGNLNYVLADVDGDDRHEIIEIVSPSEIAVYDVDTATRTPIPFGLTAENLNLFGLNADADEAEELVVGSTNNQIHIYSINASTATLDRTVGTPIGSSTVTEVARGNVAGNSADELVFVSRGSNDGPQISVAALDGSLLIDGSVQTLATGGFAAATPVNPTASGSFFAASILANSVSARGVLSVDTTGEPAPLLLDAPANAALFIAAADIDGNNQQDLLASTLLRGDTDMSILAQLTGVSGWQEPIVTGTPAPIAALQLDGTGNLEAAYIERTGTLLSETMNLVVRDVGGAEITRLELQPSGPVLQSPIALAGADLDGDADPDIVLLSTTSLQVFEYTADSLVAAGNVALDANARGLAIGDATGDGLDEIAVTKTGLADTLQVYNGSLDVIATGYVPDPTSALAFYAAGDARPLWLAGSQNQVMAVDAQSMLPVWTSPGLHGEVSSVNVHQLNSGYQLRIGTANAIYRSQP